MEQLYKGLSDGIDVSKYGKLDNQGKPVYSAEEMHELLGYEQIKQKYSANNGIKNEYRYDQIFYSLNNEGKPSYNVDQLRVLKHQFEDYYDFKGNKSMFLSFKDKDVGTLMTIISKCDANGNGIYDAKQMKLLSDAYRDDYLDLINEVDNDGNPIYDAKQMEILAKCHKAGVDISILTKKADVRINVVDGKAPIINNAKVNALLAAGKSDKDISKYPQYDAEHMQILGEALLNGTNIYKYRDAENGFDFEALKNASDYDEIQNILALNKGEKRVGSSFKTMGSVDVHKVFNKGQDLAEKFVNVNTTNVEFNE